MTPSLAELPERERARLTGADDARALASLVEDARRAHPKIAADAASFAVHVLSHVPADAVVAEHVAKMRPADLLVAYGCAVGDREAISAFERQCFDEIPFAHARVKPRVSVDEVRQMMRDRLLVRTTEAPPRIAQYAGLGELRGWFRVALGRTLLNLATRAPREIELDDAMLEGLPGGANEPELEHARRLYGPTLKSALTEAIGALEPRDRTLLRLAVCDGLTVDAIGEVYGVHRATAARWIAAARDRLHSGTMDLLRTRLGAREESVKSLLRLLASHVEISLRGHLLPSDGAPSSEP
ncbi:MAG: hypothetical protein KF850_30155 [Labilithrix sp.]|nr:hypothetical protein [Labilithrix sp.]